MSYEVIRYFTDLQDFNHAYKTGDKFPRLGMKVSEDRLKELASNKNKQGVPLIKLVKEVKELEEVAETEEIAVEELVCEVDKIEYKKTDINRMAVADLKELASIEGIANAEEMSGAELKKVLIKHFNL